MGRSRSASADEKSGTTLERMFYGDACKLTVKYAIFLLILLISPFFYNWMWRFHVTRPMRIAGGCSMSIAGFIVILALAESIGRVASRRRTNSSL
jgi:hypothetical protein